MADGHADRLSVWLRPQDIARRLQVHQATVRKLLIRGELCPYVRIGSSIRVDPAKFEAWLEEREQRLRQPRGVILKR